ncbi:MAG: glucose-1-phosphate cytidylyltransferase [Thermodesulfobacteriota bacterium]
MKVVILCGGLGTRLREETEFRPKPMVDIGPRPILWHIMKIYAHYGFTDFILALGYKSEMIKEYFYHYEIMNNDVTLELGKPDSLCLHKSHDEVGWRITLANTGRDALKGARIKRVEKYVDGDTFMLTYGDGVSDVNLERLLAFHRRHGKIATVTGISPAARFGEMVLDGDRVSSFFEKPDPSKDLYVNGGFFVLEREIFDYLSAEDECDFEHGPLEKLAQEGQLMIYRHDGFWACMDNLRDMDYLNGLWSQGKAAWKVWD